MRSTIQLLPVLSVASAVLAAPLSAAPSPTAAQTEVAPTPAALLIEGEPVPLPEYERWLLEVRGEAQAAQFGRAIALEREAARLGVQVTAEAVEAAVQSDVQVRVDHVFGGDRSGWVEELRAAGRSEAGYLAQQRIDERLNLLAKGLADIDRVVPEEKIVRDWELTYGPRGVRVGVRGLERAVEFLATGPGLTVEERRAMMAEREEAARAELEVLRARIAAGESFAALAQAESDDEATAARGGLFDGPYDPIGWPDAVTEALIALPVGQVSEPLQGRGGFWLFEVVSRAETPLASVREELHAALVEAGPENDEINAYLAELAERTTIAVESSLIDLELADRSRPALVVDDEPVSLAEYASWLRRQQGEIAARRYAEEHLIERLAAEAGIEPTAAEIDAQLREDRQRIIDLGHGGDEAKWVASLASSGRTPATWERVARPRARVTVLLASLWRRDRVVTDEHVRNLWADRYGIDGVSVEARLIAKRFELPEREEGESDRAWRSRVIAAGRPAFDELVELAARVEDGEDFATLAKRYSDDRESAVLGGVPPGGFDLLNWDEAAHIALSGLEPGQLTPPVLIDDTLYLFEVTDFVRVPFDEVAASLRAELEAAPPAGVQLAAFRNVMTRDLVVEPQPALFRP